MGIDVKKEDNEVISVEIDGEELDSDDGLDFITPKSLLIKKNIHELPLGIRFNICDRIEDGIIFVDNVPLTVTRIDNDQVKLIIEDSGRRKYWDGAIGFKSWMETKRDIIKERENELKDINLDDYDDDGDYIFMTYSGIFNFDKLKDIFELAYQITNEIDGAAELTLGSPFPKIEETNNESEFSQKVLIPIIRKLNFTNVRYNHGKREFGKDILFSRRTEFDELEFWGAQVKYGNISGAANSEIDQLISQIDDAFKIPFYDVYTRRKEKISKLLIAISGHFTENAIEKICEKIEISAIKNNLVFIDGSKIDTIAERFRK
ncbi:MAG: hypothetical protein ABSC45_10585 [Desulfobaccales bacterium]|jgi:hypothetical protein